MRLDSRRLDKTREALSITLDDRVHPIANRNIRASVGKAIVNVAWKCVNSR